MSAAQLFAAATRGRSLARRFCALWFAGLGGSQAGTWGPRAPERKNVGPTSVSYFADGLLVKAVDVAVSFADPIMRISVLIWSAVLGVILTVGFSLVGSRWQRITWGIVAAAFGCLSSPFVNRFIGMWLYQVTRKPGVGVGIMGGPPFWLSTLFAFAITGAAAVVIGRIPSNLQR